MNIYLTTDTHFNHEKMIDYCGRPDNFEELIFKGLKEMQCCDLLIHLGDICIGKDLETHNKLKEILKCKRILVKGNHDKKSNSWYLENGWDFVCNEFKDKLFGKDILFSHEPNITGDYDLNIHGHLHNNLHRLLRKEFINDTEEERNIHFLYKLTKKNKLLAIENTNYKPINLQSFICNKY